MKTIIVGLVAIAALSTGVFAAGSGESLEDKQSQSSTGSPRNTKTCDGAMFVVTAGNAIEGAVRSGSPSEVSATAEQFLDLPSISFAALGRYRKQLPKSKEAEYIALTRNFLARFVIDHASRFHIAEITIVNCSELPSGVTVNAKLANGQKAVARLLKTDSLYRIVDINLESIWLVQQMRSAFVGTIRRDGIDALFKFLKS